MARLQYYAAVCSISDFQTKKMGLAADEKPLATSSSVNENQSFLCHQDNTPPRQFLDISYEKLEEDTSGQQCAVIKKNFDALSEEINKIMKNEFESSGQKLLVSESVFHPLVFGLCLTLFAVGIWMMVSLNWFNFFALFFILGLILVLTFGFFCCCDGAGEQDKSIHQSVKPVIDEWNSTNEENGVIAEVTEEKDEYRGKTLVTIPPALNLWKRGEVASDDNARKILELEKKISDMESEKRKETDDGRDMHVKPNELSEPLIPPFPPPPKCPRHTNRWHSREH